jgi:hypothetical protein
VDVPGSSMNGPAQLTLDDLLRTVTLSEFEQAKIELEFAAAIADPQAFGLGINDVRYLRGPVVLHPGGWGVGILRKMISGARLKLLQSGEKTLSSYEEALAYLSTISLCGPLNHEYAQCMFWLCQEVLEKQGVVESVQEVLGFQKRIELPSYERDHVLRDLRYSIRSSVVKNAKAKGL